MDAAVVALLVIVGVIVAAIAVHLIAIAASLRGIAGTLVKVRGGAQAIKDQTAPITGVLSGVVADVAAIDDDLEGLLVIVGEAQAVAAAAPPAPVPPPPPARRRPPTPSPAPAPAPVLVDAAEEDGADDEEQAPRKPSMREAVARARAGSMS